MSDGYDPFVEAEIEDRLLRKSREQGRINLAKAIMEERRRRNALVYTIEVGPRAALRSETEIRDLRYFRGLFGMRIG